MSGRFLKTGLLAVAVLVAAAVITAAFLTGTQAGRNTLAGIISDRLSTPERRISIGRISGIWSGNLSVGHVVVEDNGEAWLLARNIDVAWAPMRLLSGEFKAELIRASRIEIARPPGVNGAEESGASGLPVRIDIGEIDLPDVVLDRSLAGGVAKLSVAGSVIADNAPIRIETKVSLRRTDGIDGLLEALVVYHPDGDRLELDLKGSEPGNGILVNLLGIAGRPRVDLAVTGAGPAADWSGTATLSFDGEQAARVAATHRIVPEGRHITAQGSGAFDRVLPQPYASLVAGGADFDVATVVGPAGSIVIETGHLNAAVFEANASGTFDPAGNSDIRLSARGTNGPVRLKLDQASTLDLSAVAVSMTGTGSELAVDAQGDAAALSMPSLSARDVKVVLRSDGYDATTGSGPFAIDVAGNVESSQPDLQRLAGGSLAVSATGRQAADEITLDAASLTAGQFTGSVEGTLSLDLRRFELALRAAVTEAGLPGRLSALVGEKLDIAASVAREANGAIRLRDATLAGRAFQAGGEASLVADAVQASFSGEISSLEDLAEDIKGRLGFQATLDGPLSQPKFRIETQSDEIVAAGKTIADLELHAEGIANAASPSADVRLSGKIDGAAIDGTAVLTNKGDRNVVEDLNLAVGENRIAGNLELDGGFRPTGVLDLKLPDLEQLAALAAQKAEGDMTGSLEFLVIGDDGLVTVRASSGQVRYAEVVARGVEIEAVIERYLSAPNVSGTVAVASVDAGQTSIRDLSVDLQRDGEWTVFSGKAAANGISGRLAGAIRPIEAGADLRLTNGGTVLQGIEISLAEQSQLRIIDGVARTDRLALSLGGGRANIAGTAGQELSLKAELAGVSASLANAFAAGLGASGSVSGTVVVTGQAADPEIAYDLTMADASTGQSRAAGLGAFSLRSDGRFAAQQLTFKAALTDASGTSLNSGGTVRTGGTILLDIAVNGRVPLGLLSSNTAARGIGLSGNADVDLKVTGSPPQPAVAGSITTSGARFIEARSGIAINDINADIGLSSQTATIRSLRGNLAGGGTIAASGTIGLEGGIPADLTLSIRNGRYTDTRLVTADLGGDLSFKGPLAGGGVLGGVINLNKVTISIPDALPVSLERLDVKHKNAPRNVQRQAAALDPGDGGGASSSGFVLNLTVNAPGRFFIRGRGVDAEMGGSLRLTGTTGNIRAIGAFELIRGRLSILGRRLVLTEGRVTFSGPLEPVVDFTAETDAGDVTASVRVSGLASDPEFTFSSSPALPEDEVLAQLMFGQSLSNLSPLQIAQLADAVAEVTGAGGSSGVLSKIRSQIGVDDLDVRTDAATGDTSVAVGKYLNDRTYLSIEKGSSAGSGKATIDLSIGRGLKLRGQASDSGEAKGGIFFERDY